MTLRRFARNLFLKKRNPCRFLIEKKIFTRIKNRRVLLIGVADYTADYPEILKDNDLWSMDINPLVKRFGAKKHVTGNAVKINKYFEKEFFDIILFLGVLNYGINTEKEANECLGNCFKVLKKGGFLVVGSSDGPLGSNMPLIQIRKLHNFSLFTPVKAFGIESGRYCNQKLKGGILKTVFEFLKK